MLNAVSSVAPGSALIVVSVGIVYLIDVGAACLQGLTGGGWDKPTRPAPLRKPSRKAS